MKHILLFLIFCLSSNFLLAQKTESNSSVRKFGADTILWNENYSLTHSDFKAKPSGTFQGTTFSGLEISITQDDGDYSVFVYPIFICKKSFLKDTSTALLNHERLHFDITELYSRKFNQQLDEKDFDDEKNIGSAIQKIYNSIISELNKTEDLYDTETEHGINAAKQKQWIDSIHSQLKELEEYDDVETDLD